MSKDDKVGYGKPPRETRRKKGQPSPDRGRRKPRMPETNGEVFRRLAFGLVTITEAGIEMQVPLFNAAYRAIYNKAVAGDLAAERLVNRFKKAFPGPDDSDEPILIIEE